MTGNKNNGSHYIVAIGASAGGVEALELFFSQMPRRTGMSFVILQHLSPDHKSMMDELLARKTSIPVKIAQSKMPLLPDTIYLLPPNNEMIVSNNTLYLTEREKGETLNLPINTFLRSLAESYQDKAIAVILSGSGSDGTQGIPIIHDNGGLVIVQDPDSCKFSSMPENAINTGRVDIIANPEKIPEHLVKYCRRSAKLHDDMSSVGIDAEEGRFSQIVVLLNNRYGLDFSLYKPSTITRRIERRLTICKVDTLHNYVELLLKDEEELEALYFDLLIGVTQFFRDPLAFKSLKRAASKLLDDFRDEEEIRIWVSGCATGQEVYSIAIVMHEAINELQSSQTFKIFATDIHRESIAFAAEALYKSEDLTDLDKDYKRKYFSKDIGGQYRVVPELRQTVVFAHHNLLKDPPFTKIHLVSCRNLLIYFNQHTQQHVLSLLTFALKNKGLLFLGPSESIGRHESDFVSVDHTHKLFRKMRDSHHLFDVNLMVANQNSIRSSIRLNMDVPSSVKSKKALEILLQKYVPSSILVDSTGNVLHIFGDVGKYLSLDSGTASLNIRSMVTGHAKTMIVQMMSYVNKTFKPVKSNSVQGFVNHGRLDIEMHPLSEHPADLEYILISFHETTEYTLDSYDRGVELLEEENSSVRVSELEDELRFTKESLQTTVEELASSNEKLQASNEELMSSNEELQSTNEELQSVNEELYTVNAEYQAKEKERSILAADEKSIISASGIGILFLDEELCVRKYSQPAARILKLIEQDYGRPFSAISGQLVQDITGDIRKVVNGGELVEREVEDQDGSIYQMRIHPHLLIDSSIDGNGMRNTRGVILTLSDITGLKSLQNTLKANEKRFENILNSVADGYFEWVVGSENIFISRLCLEKLGYANSDHVSIDELLADHADEFRGSVENACGGNNNYEHILNVRNRDQSTTWMLCKGKCIHEKGEQYRFSGMLIDINEYKEIEDQLKQKTTDLERSNRFLEQFAHIVSHDLRAPLRHTQNYLRYLDEAIMEGDLERAKEEIDALKNNNKRLNTLINDIIKYSSLTSEVKKNEKVDLKAVIADAIKLIGPSFSNRKAEIKYENLPVINGDKVLLTQLFSNLIDNACKYNDSEIPHVVIAYNDKKGDHVISVQDNGIGFDDEYSANIFAPFKRLVTRDKYEGSGIGLSICKTVAEIHGGAITARSVPGKGSEFEISFPKN